MGPVCNISCKADLEKAIMLLEEEANEQQNQLAGHLKMIGESFTPLGIIRDVLNEVVTSEQFRANIMTAATGITAGYVTKKLLFKESKNTLKNIATYLLQYAIANLVVNPSRTIETILTPLHDIFSQAGKDSQDIG